MLKSDTHRLFIFWRQVYTTTTGPRPSGRCGDQPLALYKSHCHQITMFQSYLVTILPDRTWHRHVNPHTTLVIISRVHIVKRRVTTRLLILSSFHVQIHNFSSSQTRRYSPLPSSLLNLYLDEGKWTATT